MKPNSRFGIGIIGCGAISSAHWTGYEALADECKIKAVCDLDEKRARQLADRGVDVDSYDDYRELLVRDDIHVVSICTPPSYHRQPVLDALRAGKHVLVEKPFGASLQECDEMIEAARACDRKLVVTFQYRYRRDFNQMRHLLACGAIGVVVFAQMNALYWRGARYYEVPWRGKWGTECGGVTTIQAIHPLDIFLWLLGDVESVYAEMDTMAHDVEVEDIAMAIIRFKNGVAAQIACTVNSVKSDISMEFSGRNRAVSFPLAFHAVRSNDRGTPEIDEDGIRELERIAAQIDTGTDDHTGPIGDLFAAIREDREPLVGGPQGRNVMETIAAMYKSATTGVAVRLPIAKDDPWYTTAGLQQLVRKGGRPR
ncbi:MAG: Gfo/Idh/MocA family oxidoreductase [Paenibacillaceae bacterium]|nr:Gfo/Idh/MocA family oxidoreductase [Paenibacillaceae bacterium]